MKFFFSVGAKQRVKQKFYVEIGLFKKKKKYIGIGAY